MPARTTTNKHSSVHKRNFPEGIRVRRLRTRIEELGAGKEMGQKSPGRKHLQERRWCEQRVGRELK